MNYNEYLHTHITEGEVADEIANIPVDLTISNLRSQIRDPFTTTVNYLEPFLENCNGIIDANEDIDVIRAVNDNKEMVVETVINEIDSRFGFDFDFTNMNDTEKEEIATVLYRFFILNYEDNIFFYIYRYIKSHRTELFNAYESQAKKKDVSTISIKKRTKDKENIIIVSALPSIINDILENGCEPEDFMALVGDDDSYEAEKIKELDATFKITGNYIHSYFSYIYKQKREILDEIYIRVRSKIISKIK